MFLEKLLPALDFDNSTEDAEVAECERVFASHVPLLLFGVCRPISGVSVIAVVVVFFRLQC
jgi:hypothetical protein